MVLIPVLTVWWTHRRGARREYGLLVGSILIVCIPLLVLAHDHHMTCTWYDGPLASGGIYTLQMPLAVFVSAVIAALPLKWKLVRNFVAILVGESLLVYTWIS